MLFRSYNENGIKDGDEKLLTADSRFTDSVTVVAYFGEDPNQWINIKFASGEHGSLDDGEVSSLHIPYDHTWGEIAGDLPSYTAEINYLTDGWYHENTPMENENRLTDGAVYTIRFYPDPAVFGTDVTVPDASAGIDTQGKIGRAHV